MNIKPKHLAVAIAFLSSNSFAYDSNDDSDLFKERESIDYVQKGIRSHSFLVLPSFDFSEEYSSNVFYQDDHASKVATDFVSHFKPGVAVKSDWNRHALNLTFDSDITEYSQHANQANYQDLKSKVDGRVDLARSSHLDGSFAYNSLHEGRGSVDQVGGIGPTRYDNKIIDGSFSHKFNRVTLKTGVDTMRYDYENVLTSTGLTLNMASRNHWEYAPSIRVGYEIQPEYEAFVKFISKQVDYDGNVLSGGSGTAFNRNSNGYNALGGLAFDLTDLITGDMSVGYLERHYDDARLSSLSGINGFFNLKWRPTTLTTVTGRVSHDINETTQAYVSGVKATAINLGLEHEFMRNVLFKAGGNYSHLDYKGYDHTSGITQNLKDRVDNMYGGNVGVKYLLNRYLNTDLTYTYQNRDANYYNSNYNVHQVMLSVRGQF